MTHSKVIPRKLCSQFFLPDCIVCEVDVRCYQEHGEFKFSVRIMLCGRITNIFFHYVGKFREKSVFF